MKSAVASSKVERRTQGKALREKLPKAYRTRGMEASFEVTGYCETA